MGCLRLQRADGFWQPESNPLATGRNTKNALIRRKKETMRKLVIVALVLVFAMSFIALAAAPTASTTAAQKGAVLASFQIERSRVFNPPTCPFPGWPGCG
jgi:hypothetical protein